MGNMHLLVLLLCFFLCQIPFSSFACRRDESLALIELNQTFTSSTGLICGFHSEQVPYSKTSSWNTTSRDCCLWDGVYCDEMTGHVIELDLSCSQLVGTIDSNSTLFQLSHLQRLNLSWNGFEGSEISPKFGEFSNLTHLDLSYSSFWGQIPTEISHLSKLRSLILPGGMLKLGPRSFELLLQNLTQLRELDLSYVNISSTIPWNFSSHITTLKLHYTGLRGMLPESIFHLPNLQVLDLGYNNQLSGYFPKTKWNSSASLRELDLYLVNFSGDMLPESLGYLSSLELLSLDSCKLSGSIPKTFSNLTRIEYLFLQNNSLSGAIPSWIFCRPSLRQLALNYNHLSGQLEDFKYNNSIVWMVLRENQLQGPLPKSLQNLVNIRQLDLSSNNFSGNVDVSIFSNLKQLEVLYLSYNSISLTNENKIKSTLPESLQLLDLAACEVKDLEFLRSTKQLQVLDLSLNKIQGRIPDWAWSNWKDLRGLNLSYNMLTSIDQIPPLASSIDLRSNFLQGSLPILPRNLIYFLISNNNLTGEIPPSICDLKVSIVLDLARNNLMGEVPQCLGNMSSNIEVLDMQHNNLSGKLQITFGFGSRLKSFNLHGNKLEGEIPRSLANCKQLEVLDLGNNRFNDTFPMWLGTLPNLQVLSLRSNKLHGPIIMTSRMDKLFPELRMLDLSSNAFTEELPTSLFHQLKAMRRNDQTIQAPRYGYYQDSVTVVTKGNELQVVRILSLYTTIDLSNNKFEGHIPKVLGDLISLRMLNLSHNGLQGYIPPSLGKLSVVESFDLSSNQLSGEIPQQLASLTSLAVLNLSHNHLEGCIPGGSQFATFGNNSYEGNDGLRGFPVSKDCGSSGIPETNNTINSVLDEESDSTFLSELSWKVVLMGYGSGLFVGFIISYFMLSSRNPNWLSWIAQELEYKIVMRRRKKQRNQRHYRRRNNGV